MTTTFFTDVHIFDGGQITGPTTVVIADGLITTVSSDPDGSIDVPDDATSVAGGGGALLPGLIDAHIHVNARKDLDALAARGVTTGFDMASWPAELTAAMRGEQGTAGIISAGLPFIGPAGPHSHFGMPPARSSRISLTSPPASPNGSPTDRTTSRSSPKHLVAAARSPRS